MAASLASTARESCPCRGVIFGDCGGLRIDDRGEGRPAFRQSARSVAGLAADVTCAKKKAPRLVAGPLKTPPWELRSDFRQFLTASGLGAS